MRAKLAVFLKSFLRVLWGLFIAALLCILFLVIDIGRVGVANENVVKPLITFYTKQEEDIVTCYGPGYTLVYEVDEDGRALGFSFMVGGHFIWGGIS